MHSFVNLRYTNTTQLQQGRRTLNIGLQTDPSQKSSKDIKDENLIPEISAWGGFAYLDPFINIQTKGSIVAVKSNNDKIPNRVAYYGLLDYVGNMEGYLEHDLDYENKSNDLVSFVGNSGSTPYYVKCGTQECDVYTAVVIGVEFSTDYIYSVSDSKVVKKTDLPG